MIQNIKVDIVYYIMATDFEFEFNLGSCCHMRLLNDRVKDRKSFVNSLARAVSRSQIIISCGPLFGDQGLIATVATAIGHELETVDNNAYGLASSEKIEIISGSVPLITPEGYFGGCIIESGSQTIIVLTENRTIRKSIMKKLIHPYIEEISIMKSAQNAPSGSIAEKVKPVSVKANEQEEYNAGFENKSLPVNDEPQTQPQNTNDFFDLNEPTNESGIGEKLDEPQQNTNDGEHNIAFDFTDSEKENDDKAPSDSPEGVPLEKGDLANNNSQDADFTKKDQPDVGGKSKGINISILIISAVLLLTILALCYFIIFLPSKNGLTTAQYFKDIFESTSHTGLI